MPYVFPTIDDFKTQFERDFPFATPLSLPGKTRAQVTAQVINGVVASLSLVSGGAGYAPTQLPGIVIYGGSGVGAAASLTVTGDAVATVTLTNGGYGYRTNPVVYVTIGGDNTNKKKVRDYDIARSFGLATQFNMTQALFGSQVAFTEAVNLLAAHYVCEIVDQGSQGLNGQATWLQAAKNVHDVSGSYAIPDRILKSPYLSKLSKTTYGAQYLELVSPLLIGNIAIARGVTLP